MRHPFFLLIFILILIPVVLGSGFCSVENSSSCSVEEGELRLDAMETNAFISEAEGDVCIIYFYSPTCPHCRQVKPFIDSMEKTYQEDVRLTRLDVTDPRNIRLYEKLCSKRDYEGKSIPLVGINDRLLIGENQIRENLEDEIKRGIAMDEKSCPLGEEYCPMSNYSTEDSDPLISGIESLDFYSIMPVIVVAGLGDGVNPCAFIILVFVMVFLQKISGSKRRLVKVTLAYIIMLFLSNVALGLLYYGFTVRLGIPDIIRTGVIIICLVAGAINIKDFFAYGKGVSLGIPKRTKDYLQSLINKASVPAAVVLGVSVAVLEAPCSVPIYRAVIELLRSAGSGIWSILPYILLYNLMFIVPLIVIAVAVYVGYRADILEQSSLRLKRYMKLTMGILLLVLAALLVSGII